MQKVRRKLMRGASGPFPGERAGAEDFARRKRKISQGLIEAQRHPYGGAARRF